MSVIWSNFKTWSKSVCPNMTFVNLGSQGQHFNEKADQQVYVYTHDNAGPWIVLIRFGGVKGGIATTTRHDFPSSPFVLRCVEEGSPWPCWWWRRCRARWSGRPSRRGWGSLGEERRGETRVVIIIMIIVYLWRLVETQQVSAPSSSCERPEGPAVGLSPAGRGLGRSRTWGCWVAEEARRAAWCPASSVSAGTDLRTERVEISGETPPSEG